jgi:hypothetical protein
MLFIIGLAAQAPHRRRPLNSNVRPHKTRVSVLAHFNSTLVLRQQQRAAEQTLPMQILPRPKTILQELPLMVGTAPRTPPKSEARSRAAEARSGWHRWSTDGNQSSKSVVSRAAAGQATASAASHRTRAVESKAFSTSPVLGRCASKRAASPWRVGALSARSHPRCGLTRGSSRAPTAGHQARAVGTQYIFVSPGLASHRRCRLSSNVRPHRKQSCRSRPRRTSLHIARMQNSRFSFAQGNTLRPTVR